MLIDKFLMFSDAQAITAAAASDSYLDLDEVRDIGTGAELYVVCVVTTAFTDGSSDSTLTVSLYGDSSTTFTPDGSDTLFTIPALAAVGDTFIARLDPAMAALQFRYAELYYTPNNGNLTTGSLTSFITNGIQRFKAYAKNYTIS
jgi:hypothetical protein